MEFWAKWIKQVDLFLGYMGPALIAAIILACFGAKVRVRYLVGSIFFGSALGLAVGSVSDNDGWIIFCTILGVVTAPLTIARWNKMTMIEALNDVLGILSARAEASRRIREASQPETEKPYDPE